MIETHLNMFDAVVLSIMLFSCVFAFFRGLIREILSLAAWIGAGVVTVYYYHPVAEWMQQYFKTTALAVAVAGIGVYIAALMGFAMINLIIVKTIKQGGDSGVLDNMLGLIFGAVRGAFIVSLGFFMITMVVSKDEYPSWVKESITHPYAEKGAYILTRLAPESLEEISALQKETKEKLDAQGDKATGYSRESAKELDRMIENAEPSR